MLLRCTALAAIGLAAMAPPASAQVRTLALGPVTIDTTRVEHRLDPIEATPTRIVLPAIIARAELGSYQVVEVPIPREVPRTGSSRWELEVLGSAGVLSARSGVVSGDSLMPGRRTSLLVTFAVPRRARAGILPVANVRFLASNGQAVEVPVHLLVADHRDIEITVTEALRGVRPGDRFDLRFRLTNLGNATAAVEVRTELPPSWRARLDGDRVTTLVTHGMVERTLSVTVPLGTATGDATVRLIALVAGAPVATATARITVQRDNHAEGDGPLATITTAVGRDADGVTTTGVALELAGKLTDAISVSARMSQTAGDASGSYALSRAGLYHTRPQVRFVAPTWALALGVTGESFSDLTGTGVAGQGISGTLRRGRIMGTAMFARSIDNLPGEPGLLAGGRVAIDVGSVVLSGTASHLREVRGEPRRLDALALEAQLPDFLSGALAAEVAQRWTARGAHPGAALRYDQHSDHGTISLSAIHAPGGGSAFARATNEVSASASRAFGDRVSVFGSFWSSDDRGSRALGELRSMSASVGASRRMTRAIGVSVSLQHNAFSTTGATSGFGSDQTEGTVAVAFTTGGFRARAAGMLGEAGRTTRFDGQGTVTEDGARRTLDGAVGWTGARGTVELTGRLEQNEIGSGTVPRQVEVALRASEVPVITVGSSRLVVGAAVRRNAWPGFAPARWTTSVNAEAQLAHGFTIAATAERNPYLQTAGGSGGWLYGLRVGRVIGLPRVVSSASRGVVFEDRNDNGVRDPGEHGLPNVVVRHRDGTAVTDAAGHYRFAGAIATGIEVDPASLPIGMIVKSGSHHDGSGDLPVIAVAPVRVELRTASDSTGRSARIDLGPAVVMARHASGRLWISRKLQAGVAVFDALPPGRYEVVLDLHELSEPLEVHGALPTFEISGSAERDPIAITLHTRRISIKRIAPSATVVAQP